MKQLRVQAEQTARAAPASVWALISDATRYPQWGPWSAAGYRTTPDNVPDGAVGSVYWLKSAHRAYLRYATTVEQVLEVEEGRRLAYTVLGGIPVRNYRAEITLTPDGQGTHIRWAATWDATPAGRIVRRSLAVVYPEIVASLARAAERR